MWRKALIYAWTSPTSAVGLFVALLGLMTGGRTQIVDGVLEAHGGAVALLLRRCTLLKGGASAMTLGHVVLGRDLICLERTRAHERIHVLQAQRWGPMFIPAYIAASAWVWLRGKRAYLDNPFEREAYDKAR